MSLYTPYKAVGVVTDGKPFAVNHLGEETFISVTIGSLFQVYRTDKLTVCLVARETPNAENITCLQVAGKETFCAVGSDILVYDRTRIVRKYEEHSSPILGMCMVGRMLLSWDSDRCLRLIDTQKRTMLSTLHSLQESAITAVAHPATYLNKFVVGYANGALELWNVSKQKLVYTFGSHIEMLKIVAGASPEDEDEDFFARNVFNKAGRPQPGVSCLEQSPAVDVFGVGFTDGTILLLNLKLDRVLFSFKQDGGAVMSLSFRTDAGAQSFPFMASGSADGRVHIWNLGTPKGDEDSDDAREEKEEHIATNRSSQLERKLQYSLDEAHSGRVGRVHFLHGEPILITSAQDNSIKMWIFDAPDGTARLLRSREGHNGHPVKIRAYGGDTAVSMRDNATAESCEIVSAGVDGTVRLLNTAIESQNREMSQKPILKKLGLQRRNERLPPVLDFDFSETRARDWGNMVTIHRGHANAYVWRYKHRVVTEMVLRQPNWGGDERIGSADRHHHSTAVCVTPCGNFAIVGSRSGNIYRYNLQSGLPRGSYPPGRGTTSVIKQGTLLARKAVPGNVLHDKEKLVGGPGWVPLNPTLAMGGTAPAVAVPEGHDGEVRGLFVDLTNSILASCGLDGHLLFWDLESGQLLRAVHGASPCIQMVGFRDAGFIAVASQDRVVRIYDLATFKLSRRFEGHSREITDLAFTPDGRRLLTSSADCTVRVWDMPTGRCLSWLSFGSPVLSMAMALSGESLSIAQAGKDGVYVYIDRSLYEAVQFWKEPTAPTQVLDSAVAVSEERLEIDDKTVEDDETEGELQEDNRMVEEGGEIKAPQAQVQSEQLQESVEQRGKGVLTTSALPRGYWASLFHLEALKARNKPTAPTAPKKAAPFFLPTMFRGGSTSSFPTPQEYAELQNKLKAPTEGVEGVAAASHSELEPASKKRKAAAVPVRSSAEELSQEQIMAELAMMGSAWADDADSPTVPRTSDKLPKSRLVSSGAADFRGSVAGPGAGEEDFDSGEWAEPPRDLLPADMSDTARRSQSRIISRKTALPRCKLVAYLLKEFPDGALGTYTAIEYFKGASASTEGATPNSPTLDYMKTLAPPAVDLELRSLCSHDKDEEGLQLLHCLLMWITERFRTGLDFEVMEAYLHRTLLIHGELIVAKPSLLQLSQSLADVHAACTERLRTLVQGNLCLLKMLANLPPL